MPFQVSAHKVKMIVKQNPQLKIMVVDFWPKKMFDGNTPFGFYPYSVSLIELMTRENMPPIDYEFIVRLSKGVICPGIKNLFKQTARSQIGGGFVKLHECLLDNKWSKKETYTKHDMYQLGKTPLYMERVLEELIVWLKEHNVTVVLTSTPLWHMWWENYYSEEAREYFTRRMNEIARKHNVTWYNWLHEYQDYPEYWADGDHLNDIGAKVFSREKRKLLESHLSR